jgi:pyrimidine-nucleoside phosphorylase
VGKQLFGTDGIRGVAGQYPLDLATTYAVGVALGRFAARTAPEPEVLLGMDTRESGPWIAAQGGDLRAVDEPARLPHAPIVRPLAAPQRGYVGRLDAREVGFTVVDLGGGRALNGDAVDPAVGVVLTPDGKVGGRVEAGQPLLWVHARSEATCAAALARLAAAYAFSDAPVSAPPVVHRVIR